MPALHLHPWTDQRRLADQEYQGRSARTLAGSHISDLVSLRKAIILCPTCRPKFDDKASGYVTTFRIPMCGGRCDGCRENGMDRKLFVHHKNMPR